jgi:8-oxo-dGTP diphosphatase
MEITKFNVRVYGIVLHNGAVLVTDEFRLGHRMTKFPGGGLEFGEGTADCLRREFMEELNVQITIKEHIYTTDYFQPTMLLAETQQLISIYYRVELLDYSKVNASNKSFDFIDWVEGAQCFRWIMLDELTPEELTFPIDKRIVSLLKQKR